MVFTHFFSLRRSHILSTVHHTREGEDSSLPYIFIYMYIYIYIVYTYLLIYIIYIAIYRVNPSFFLRISHLPTAVHHTRDREEAPLPYIYIYKYTYIYIIH